MRFIRPNDILAGFWVDSPLVGLPEMRQFGEHWVGEHFAVPTHRHWYWDLHYQVDGFSEWKHTDGVSRINPGDAYLVAPGESHQSVRFSSGKQHFFFMEIDFRPWLTVDEKNFRDAPFRVIPRASSLQPLCSQVLQEVSYEKANRVEALKHILGLITLEVERLIHFPQAVHNVSPNGNCNPAILKARDLIEQRPGNHWRIDELAHLVGISPNYLITTFKKTFGQTPIQYMHSRRIEKAKQLLIHEDFTLSDIAQELGYSSSQHFSARFKYETGASPGAHRRGISRAGW